MKTDFANTYTIQPARLEDIQKVVTLCNSHSLHYLGMPSDTLDDLKSGWAAPVFNLARDTCIISNTQGDCIGMAEFWDTNSTHIRYHVRGVVHPAYEGQGLGTYLLNWLETRAQESIPLAPEGAQVEISHGIDARLEKSMNFLQTHGYENIRSHYHMHIELDRQPPDVQLPDGFSLRPYQGEVERRELIRSLYDAFHDHWGFIEEPFEDYYQRWVYIETHRPDMDPALWYLAIQDGKVAGALIGAKSIPEDADMGWVQMLGIRREFRKMGLGLAFLQAAFREFYRRGKQRAGLGVDASSLTGAVRLYERAGMHVARRFNSYVKIVRPGQIISTQSL
jgi:mycothiol synthase